MMKNCEILDTDGIMFKYTCGLIMEWLCEVSIQIYSSKGNKNECKRGIRLIRMPGKGKS